MLHLTVPPKVLENVELFLEKLKKDVLDLLDEGALHQTEQLIRDRLQELGDDLLEESMQEVAADFSERHQPPPG